jgi:hypothetical protein
MSKWDWVVIWVLLAVGVGTAVWADKGSYLNAVVTGQCNACPAPPVCTPYSRFGGRYGRPPPPPIDGCDPPWWRRFGTHQKGWS